MCPIPLERSDRLRERGTQAGIVPEVDPIECELMRLTQLERLMNHWTNTAFFVLAVGRGRYLRFSSKDNSRKAKGLAGHT